MSELVHRIKAVMDLPREYEPAYHLTWPTSSLTVFLEEDQNFVDKLADTSSHLLREFPYTHTSAIAQEARTDFETLTAMRFHRKALMIGRDALNLCNLHDLIDNENTRPVTTFATSLGKLADKDGRGKKLRNRIALEAIDAENAAQYIVGDFLCTVSTDELRWRCESAIDTSLLDSDPSTLHTLDEEAYHTARRAFRSMVHLGIMSHLVSPSDDKLKYVKQGIELNRVYGENHDFMVAQQKQQLTSTKPSPTA